MIHLEKYRQALRAVTDGRLHFGEEPEPQAFRWSCTCGDNARYYTLHECVVSAEQHCMMCKAALEGK